MKISTLNAVLEDGRHDDIIAIAVVENEEEGELWFCENKPDWTQVDYVLHDIETVFAAPALLAACKDSPSQQYFADFARLAERFSQKPSMAIYKPRFIAMATFLRRCESSAINMETAIEQAES